MSYHCKEDYKVERNGGSKGEKRNRMKERDRDPKVTKSSIYHSTFCIDFAAKYLRPPFSPEPAVVRAGIFRESACPVMEDRVPRMAGRLAPPPTPPPPELSNAMKGT